MSAPYEVVASHKKVHKPRRATRSLWDAIASVAEARAQMTYGKGIDLSRPALWTDAIEQRTRQMNPRAGRSWVTA